MDKEKKALFNSFKLKIALMVVITIVASSAATFGFFYANRTQSGTTDLTTSCFDVAFTEGTSFIDLSNAAAQTDNSGQNNTPYTFTITNNCDLEASYFVILSTKAGSFDGDYVSVSLNKEQARILSNTPVNNEFAIDDGYDKSYILKTGSLTKDATATYDVRAWINGRANYANVQGQSWEAEIKVVSTVKDLEDKKDTVVDKIIEGANTGSPNFASASTTDEGVYSMEDNYGTSYYFRGAVENNYVKFANLYWRIIRVNGDGSLRIIYDGTEPHTNGESNEDRVALKNVAWNTTNYDDAKYVGYMYGGANGEASTSKEQAQANETSSNIKVELERWYVNNILNPGYSDAVADVIFCNDRSTASSAYTSWDTTNGYGTQATAYGTYRRFITTGAAWNTTNPLPTFVCPINTTVNSTGNNDWFTAEATTANKGNGDLEYPVGMITADEIVTAGSGINTNNTSYYLYKGNYSYWSLSPRTFYDASAHVFMVADYGNFGMMEVYNDAGAIAPVINLTPEYIATMHGSGTMEDPYQSWEY